MVAHIVLDVAVADGSIGLDPERQSVVLGQIAVKEGQVAVHNLCFVVMAEEAPNAGLAVADGAEVQRAVSLAEAEVLVRAVIITLLACKRDDIGRIHALALYNAETTFFVGLADLCNLGELADTAGIGIGGNAVVRKAHGNPNGTLVIGTLADELHDPGLVLVAYGEGLAGVAVSIFLDKVMHNLDGLPGGSCALQSKVHELEVAKPALLVVQLLAAVPGCFYYSYLILVHKTGHIVGIFCLRNIIDCSIGAPSAAYCHHLARSMTARSRVVKICCKAKAVAVVSADDAAVYGSLLTHDKIGTSIGINASCKQEHGRYGQED